MSLASTFSFNLCITLISSIVSRPQNLKIYPISCGDRPERRVTVLDFAPSKEQEMVRNAVRAFAEEVIGPSVAERDEAEEYPSDLVEQMADLNLFGLTTPLEYGGAGSDSVSYAIA
ncbi:MAG: hypothetical protein GQ558_05595, partial [Thermoplasmata archaeon]|nr:hypothetical protein [Thermoplasmata archaeon]